MRRWINIAEGLKTAHLADTESWAYIHIDNGNESYDVYPFNAVNFLRQASLEDIRYLLNNYSEYSYSDSNEDPVLTWLLATDPGANTYIAQDEAGHKIYRFVQLHSAVKWLRVARPDILAQCMDIKGMDKIIHVLSEALKATVLAPPEIRGEVHSDDWHAQANFNAVQYFFQADDNTLRELLYCNFTNDYPTDYCAEFMADHDADVRAVFDYIHNYNSQVPDRQRIGFACSLDIDQAVQWLKYHRPEVLVDSDHDDVLHEGLKNHGVKAPPKVRAYIFKHKGNQCVANFDCSWWFETLSKDELQQLMNSQFCHSKDTLEMMRKQARIDRRIGEFCDYDHFCNINIIDAMTYIRSRYPELTRHYFQEAYIPTSMEQTKFFHVCLSRDLPSIMEKGLIPQQGARTSAGQDPASVYLFDSEISAEDAVMGWLGDNLPEDEPLAMLEVSLPAGTAQRHPEFPCEYSVNEVIPPAFITVLKTDL